MKPQDLQKLIEELEKASANDNEAYLGIFLLDEYDEEGYIKANKRGLELTAAAFLRSVADYYDAKNKGEGLYLELNKSKPWFDKDSHIALNFIEIVENTPTITDEKEPKWRETLVKYGCIFMIIIGFIAAIIGLFTIGDWLLN